MSDTPEDTDRTKVSFSQAEGLEPLPSQLALGELSQEARSLIWSIVYRELQRCISLPFGGGFPYLVEPWLGMLREKHVSIDHNPIDEFSAQLNDRVRELKNLIMHLDYNTVFDFLQFIMRCSACPVQFRVDIGNALSVSRTAYTLVDGERPTIIPT